MKKATLISIYIFILLLASAGISYFIWKPDSDASVSQSQIQEYKRIKDQILQTDDYVDIDDDNQYVDVKMNVNAKYLWVEVTFKALTVDLFDVKTLIIDQNEKTTRTDTAYPSIGIFDHFHSILAKSNPDKANNRYSVLSLTLAIDEHFFGLLIYFGFTLNDNSQHDFFLQANY